MKTYTVYVYDRKGNLIQQISHLTKDDANARVWNYTANGFRADMR